MSHVIYTLIDPRDNREFYVGRTEDIYQRFCQHLRCDGRNDAKNTKVIELRSCHLLPIMKNLEIIEDAALAAQREAYWIRHFRYLGIELANDIVYSKVSVPDEAEPSENNPCLKVKAPRRPMSIKQAAVFLGITDRQVRRLREQGILIVDEDNQLTSASVRAYQKKRPLKPEGA